MFNHAHYVPVLFWKRGEQDAVQQLTYEDKRRMTPLLEIPADRRPPRKEPKRPRPKRDWLVEMAMRVQHCWDSRLPAFVELVPEPAVPITSAQLASCLPRFFHAARLRDLGLIPVVRLAYEEERRTLIGAIVEEDGQGVCIRLTPEDLGRPSLREDLEQLLAQLATPVERAHLVVDFHVLGAEGFNLLLLCAQIPFLQQWQTFTVVGGAFPSGLARLEYGPNSVPRSEWLAWSTQVLKDLPRKPAFGDYATQHPVPFNSARHPNPCANIRYTLEHDWRVMKGRQLVPRAQERGDSDRYEQFPAMAVLLVDARDHMRRPYFRGDSFSRGDHYIQKMASKYQSDAEPDRVATGTPTTWLTAAVNHHLTFVVIQIATLFSPSGAPGRAHATAPAGPPPRGGYTAPPFALRKAPSLRRVAPKA